MFIVGNEQSTVRQMYDALGVRPDKRVLLQDFVPDGDVPVVLSSSGYYHGDSLVLTCMLKNAGVPIDVKVMFDQHPDVYPTRNEWYDIQFPSHRLSFDGSVNFYRTSREYYATHIFSAHTSQLIPEICLLGVDDADVFAIMREHEAFDPSSSTVIKADRTLRSAQRITGKRLHVSIDIDVLRAAECVEERWVRSDGPSLEELSEALSLLGANNRIAAVDIVGYVGRDLPRSDKTETEGVGIYRSLLEALSIDLPR